MSITEYLERAGVPAPLWGDAETCLAEAERRATRIAIVKSEWADYDVAPMLNINADWKGDPPRPTDENVLGMPVDGAQLWYPLEGYELRAPLTGSALPGR